MKIFPFLLFLLLLSGCIKEDMDDCKGSISLNFSYTADGSTQVFNEYIDESVDLYVFDEDRRYILTRRIVGAELQGRHATLDLEPGRYHIVCVGNMGQMDEVKGLSPGNVADLTRTLLTHKKETENPDGTLTGEDPLYMGTTDVEVKASDRLQQTVDFRSLHVNLVVQVKGAARDEAGATPSVPVWTKIGIRFTGLPTETELSEGLTGGPLCDYVPPTGQFDPADRLLTTSLHVMRFDRRQGGLSARQTDDDIRLVVTNLTTGEPLETIDVMEFVTDNDIDLDREEVTIGMLIVISKDGDISVEVPDWDIEDVTPGL